MEANDLFAESLLESRMRLLVERFVPDEVVDLIY